MKYKRVLCSVRVELENLRVCSSCLENERKAELSQALSSLGGQLVSSWDQDCTHLVMPSVKVTIKVSLRTTITDLKCCFIFFTFTKNS